MNTLPHLLLPNSRNKSFILSWNKVQQLCHSEVVLLISWGLCAEDRIPLISSLQFLFVEIAPQRLGFCWC